MPLTVSDTVSIMCSSDLEVMTIKWITDGIIVDSVTGGNSSNKSTLLLDPVSADHHNTHYTCRVTSPYGTQEETINITVQSKSLCCTHTVPFTYIMLASSTLLGSLPNSVINGLITTTFSPPVLGHSPDQYSTR